jgi:ABC-type nickel/cobalt efflux system permease component RcnA
MGNFTISHYAKFQVGGKGVDLTYVLDLAELPTTNLLQQWGLDRNTPQAVLDRRAAEQAREWASHLEITSDGKPVPVRFVSSNLVIADGAGDLPILRITSHLHLSAAPGQLLYEDKNYPERAGWKEIVIDAGQGAAVSRASQGGEDRSKALAEYPQDPTLAPPQDLRASIEWTATRPAAPVIAPIPQPKAIPTPAPATMTPKAAPAGAVVKGDYISRMLHNRELSFGMILILIAVAFGLGAAHALTPGHGKTIVAAYLVGSRGTLKHAAFLGAMVTFTHTISVFLLGLATLFLFQYVVPEKITQVLGVVSGLSIVAIGAWMLYKRLRGTSHTHQHHGHAHDHDHGHDHAPAHDDTHAHDRVLALTHDHALAHADAHDLTRAHNHAHAHDLAHAHGHAYAHDHVHDRGHAHDHPHTHEHPHTHDHHHVHEHGTHTHTHDMPDRITWGSLTALAVSGGLVPCESALLLLLSAIALGRVGLGLLLLVAFSLGLAVVLVGIGVVVIYAKNLLPKSTNPHPAFRWIPVASAAIVMIAGLLMTGASLGWIGQGWIV